MICLKNFLGTQKQVWIGHFKQAISVWAIEIRLYIAWDKVFFISTKKYRYFSYISMKTIHCGYLLEAP